MMVNIRYFILLAGCGSSAEPPTSIDASCYEALLANNAQVSGLAVAIVHHGDIVYAKGFGSTRPGGSAVTPATRFRIASNTKMLTAAAAFALADRGTIALDAPVASVLPASVPPAPDPHWADHLTLRALLTHTGALHDDSVSDGPRDDAGLARSWRDATYLAAHPLIAPAGLFFDYSNPNFALGGLMLETAAGAPYRDVVSARVFAPLAMDRATFSVDDVQADGDFAAGLVPASSCGAIQEATCYDNAALRPAGWAWASVDDMAKFGRFLVDGDDRVMSAASHAMMQSPQVSLRYALDHFQYGFGVFVDDFAALPDETGKPQAYPITVVHHEGNLPGYTALMYTLPDLDLAISVLANGDSLDLTTCTERVARSLIADELPAPETISLPDDHAHWPDWVGDYDDTFPDELGRATIAQDAAGNLTITLPDLDGAHIAYDHKLTPVTPDNFELAIGGMSFVITGIRNGDSAIAFIAGREFVLGRRSSATR